MRALIVEDEAALAGLLVSYFERDGFAAFSTGDGLRAVELAREVDPDVVVLDLGLPGLDGVEVCRQLRTFSDAYVVMVTARSDEVDTLIGLSVGADDYLTKPFSPRTLLARVKALLRRAGMENSAPLAAGRVQLDLEEHTVQVGSQTPVRLTKLELRLLQMLVANAGHTVSSDRLLMQVWGHKGSGDRQLLKQLVHRLRQKIEIDPADPQMLQTAPGAGYKLVVE
jgi:DNA-binding response OmpR family regulator